MTAFAYFTTLALLVGGPLTSTLHAQSEAIAPRDTLTITASSALESFRGAYEPIRLTLSRPLRETDGSLAFLAGTVDVSVLTTVTGTQVVVTPGPFPLPSGESTLTVFQKRATQWDTLATFPLRITTIGGFSKIAVAPALELSANGLLLDGASDAAAVGGSRRQDITLSGSFGSTLERTGATMQTQSSIVGATREELALRFSQRGARAPLVDLSAYQVGVQLPHTQVDIGHLSLGANRHLLSGFSSRGVSVSTGPAWARMTVGSVAGAPIVGWDNLIGISQSAHRVNSAGLTLEMVRARPGAVQLRVSALDGSLLPITGFTQGAVVDAEESRGAGIEVTAATPGQRARLSAGLSRSAFRNPARDPELTDGLAVRSSTIDRRGARYLEASLGVVNGAKLFARVPTQLTVGVRHERVDPLYRSVGAFAQADREQDAVDLTGTLDVVTWQAGVSRGRDNLAAIRSVLTSRSEGATANLSMSTASLFRIQRRAIIWPQLSIALVQGRQFAESAPASNDFRPQDLADQANSSAELSAQWQLREWRVSFRDNHTVQDNRQQDREAADFAGNTQALSVGRAVGSTFDATLDLGNEHQRNRELAQVTRVRRVGSTANWRPTSATAISTNLTAAVSRTPPSVSDVVNLETRIELSHRLHLFGRAPNARTAQMFLRYARTTITSTPFDLLLPDAPPPSRATQMRWSLNSGLSLKAW